MNGPLDTTAEEDITISDPEPSKRLKNNDGSSISTSTNVRNNIFVAEHKVSRMQRGASHDIERKFRGCVAWFTGLSGAGKSTVSMGVEKELVSRGIRYVLHIIKSFAIFDYCCKHVINQKLLIIQIWPQLKIKDCKFIWVWQS